MGAAAVEAATVAEAVAKEFRKGSPVIDTMKVEE